MQTVVSFIKAHQEKVPEFVKVLTAMMVADEDGTMIRRNQTLVMDYFLQEYPKDAYVLELPLARRLCSNQIQYSLKEMFDKRVILLIS